MTDERKCSECSMPIDDETECECQPNKCYHCCECGDNCECGCDTKKENDKKEQ